MDKFVSVTRTWLFLVTHRLCSKNSWIKRDHLHVTCFIISLCNAQHVSDANTSILGSLRLIYWVISWVVLLRINVCWCYVVVWLGWCGIRMRACLSLFNYQGDARSNKHKYLKKQLSTEHTVWSIFKRRLSTFHDIECQSTIVFKVTGLNSYRFSVSNKCILWQPVTRWVRCWYCNIPFRKTELVVSQIYK